MRKDWVRAVLYQIDYDLRKPGRNYEELYTAIKALSGNNWARPLKSTWIVKSTLNTEQIRDRLKTHIDVNDGLLVTRLTGEMSWYGLSADVEKWLRAA